MLFTRCCFPRWVLGKEAKIKEGHMAFLPETTGYLHLSPPVCPGPQLMLSWPPWANSQTPRQPGTVPMAVGHKGQENAHLLPVSCPHRASGGTQYVHTLKDGSKSSTVHNSSLAPSQDQNQSGDVREQPATWSQGCSPTVALGGTAEGQH